MKDLVKEDVSGAPTILTGYETRKCESDKWVALSKSVRARFPSLLTRIATLMHPRVFRIK